MKVIIAIDDSQCSFDAVDSAVERTWPPDTEFCILTVIEPAYVRYLGDLVNQAEQEFASRCRQSVADKVAHFKTAHPEFPVTGLVLEGNVVDSIIEEAIWMEADLIIVGSHGLRGLDKLFLGSVAEKLAGSAPCSVEIVRARNKADHQQQLEAFAASTKGRS